MFKFRGARANPSFGRLLSKSMHHPELLHRHELVHFKEQQTFSARISRRRHWNGATAGADLIDYWQPRKNCLKSIIRLSQYEPFSRLMAIGFLSRLV
jgi:hypothetical protein